MSTGDTWTLGRRPTLDGLRGLAVLLVLAGHSGVTSAPLGDVGVTAFFTLSGFLITALLLEERARNGAVRLGAFFARRARRLTPALLACCLVTAAVAVPAGLLSGGQLLAALTYTTDFVAAGSDRLNGLLGHTWSLAVEEQFYLMWPLMLLALRSRRAVLWATGVGVAVVGAWRFYLAAEGAGWARLTYGPDVRADALLVGCFLAALLVGRRPVVRLPAWLGLVALLAIPLGAAMPLTWRSLVVAALTAVVIYASVVADGLRVLSSSALRLVGQRSYGLYLWHYPVVLLTAGAVPEWGWAARMLVWLPIAVALTALSWRYVEEPFLRRSRGSADRVAAPVGGVRGAALENASAA